tara:strand:- start:2564 stop:2917 length:354 start_codon:yes stop_codon:yes gene_type:complete
MPMRDIENRKWLAGIAMSAIANPNITDDDKYEARQMIYDLVSKSGKVTIPQFTTEPSSRKRGGKRMSETKRKPSAYNKFVKKLSKQPKYKKMNNKRRLKAIAVAWRKTPAGKKKRGK